MRCYNGQPDTALQNWLDRRAAEHKRLAEAIPGARAVWFPMEEQWQVFVGHHSLGDMCFELTNAIDSALAEYKKHHSGVEQPGSSSGS